MKEKEITTEELDAFCGRIGSAARASGYFLNPDEEFMRDLARSLLVNEDAVRLPILSLQARLGGRGRRSRHHLSLRL